MKHKHLVRAALLMMSAAVIGGCKAAGTETAASSDTNAQTETADVSDTAYTPVTIQNGDRTVTFTKMPEKVLCANLYAAENMVMLGLGDRVAPTPRKSLFLSCRQNLTKSHRLKNLMKMQWLWGLTL